MLGKLETVFQYMTHFVACSWPEQCPGYLFLTDAGGRLLKEVSLRLGQSPVDRVFPFQPGDDVTAEAGGAVGRALASGAIAISRCPDKDASVAWAVVPLVEPDGRPRAAVGLAVPTDRIDFDLASFARGLDPLIRMGYDAYIQHATSEIVMNVNRFEHTADLVQDVIERISEIIDKGYCSAVRLDEKGFLVPQIRHTTEPGDKGHTCLEQLLSRLLDQPVRPMRTDRNRVVAFPVTCEGKPLYALFLHLPPDDQDCAYDDRDVAFLQTVGEKISYALLRATVADEMRREAKKKDLLYQLSMKIQASIDVNEVLSQIMHSIRQLYPYFAVELYLTVETNTSLPVKPFSLYGGESEHSRRAYLEGRMVVHHGQSDGEPETVVAAPLLGKQGIYGVLQLTAREYVSITESEQEYISMLAETAGTAFENAQLYQQSRNLVRELRMINEMAQQLNKSLKLDELLTIVRERLEQTFRPEYSAILRREGDDGRLAVLADTGGRHTGRTVSAGEYPLSEVIAHKRPVILATGPGGGRAFSLTPFASLMAVPLLENAAVSGALLVTDSRPHVFSFDDLKLLEIFGQHASLALTNTMLHRELERLVITDNLTGLYTRRYLNEQIRLSLERDGLGSLMLIDIDYFKQVNDTFGHQSGDEVLSQVSRLIRQCLSEPDVAARWGGEEIAVYLPRTDAAAAQATAEQMRLSVALHTAPRVTISCGIAGWWRENGPESVETLFHRADTALYEAKKGGRNQVRVYALR